MRSRFLVLTFCFSLAVAWATTVSAQSIAGGSLTGATTSGWGKGGKPKPTPRPTPAPTPAPTPMVDAQQVWKNVATDFNAGSSWNSGTAPGALDVAAFTTAGPTNQPNVTLSTTVGGLYFSASGYTLSASGGATLTLDGHGTANVSGGGTSTAAPAIQADNATGTNTISAPLSLSPDSGTTSTFSQTGGGTLTISGVISGTAGLSVTGGGTVTFSGANTYSGGTTIDAGKLLADNTTSTSSATGSGAVIVNSGGTLGGVGFIDAGSNTITINGGGTLLGGDGSVASGTLTLKGAVQMNNSSIISLALGSSLTHSTLAIGTGGSITFAPAGQQFTFIELSGVTTGTYDNIITGVAISGSTTGWSITNAGWVGTFSYDGLGNIDLNLTTVPEPSTWVAAALAAAVIGYSFSVNRKRKKRIGASNAF